MLEFRNSFRYGESSSILARLEDVEVDGTGGERPRPPPALPVGWAGGVGWAAEVSVGFPSFLGQGARW